MRFVLKKRIKCHQVNCPRPAVKKLAQNTGVQRGFISSWDDLTPHQPSTDALPLDFGKDQGDPQPYIDWGRPNLAFLSLHWIL